MRNNLVSPIYCLVSLFMKGNLIDFYTLHKDYADFLLGFLRCWIYQTFYHSWLQVECGYYYPRLVMTMYDVSYTHHR